MKDKKKNPTLSDKIAEALTVKPRPDIEDDHVFHTKPRTLTRAELTSSDSEDENAISDFRKQNINFLSDVSKKYEGEVVLRKSLCEHSDSSIEVSDSDVEAKDGLKASDNSEDDEKNEQQSDDTNESDDYSITKFKKQLGSGHAMEQSADEESDGGPEEDETAEENGEGYDISQMEESMKESFEHVKKQNVSEESKKGNCVRNQLLLWEGLLEMRIHLQRCVNAANRMPLTDCYNHLKENKKFATDSFQTVNNITNVLEKFLTLQNMLLKTFPETKSLVPKDQQFEKTKQECDKEIPMDSDNEEIPSDTDEEDNIKPEIVEKTVTRNQRKRNLEDYELELATSHKVFKRFRETTIQKWNDKTRLATAANIKNTPTNTILQQISYILSDRHKLIRRTQLKRSEYDIIGYKGSEESNNQVSTNINPVIQDRKDYDEYIVEIFDDRDFYHQLLRELIECKSADISDPVQLSRQWISLQQMRSKMKRKVDTKATKGRRIKYVVHNPLVNYMAPEKSLTWNKESTSELFNSLFGKMFEQNNISVNTTLEDGKKII